MSDHQHNQSNDPQIPVDLEKPTSPLPSDKDIDAHVQEDSVVQNDVDPETASSRLAVLKLTEEKTKIAQYNAQLQFMSEDVDDDGDLQEVETGFESLEEDDEGFFTGVLLGYLEQPTHKYSLRRDYFPSKAGGRPAWLNPKDIPEPTCKHCNSPMKFLLQLYSPLPATATNTTNAFHRAVFVFCCPDQTCFISNNSVLIYRNQLPRTNPYYSAQPPVDVAKAASSPDEASPDVLPFDDVHVCVVCGAKGSKRCGECKSAHYCSKQHQVDDWAAGHKQVCGKNDTSAVAALERARALMGFPAFEIVTEEEAVDADFKFAGDHERDMIAKYDEDVSQMTAKERAEDEQAFQSMFGGMGQKNKSAEGGLALTNDEDNADALFVDFQARVSYNPEQVVRYIPYHRRQRALLSEGKPAPAPLWTSVKRRLATKNVPCCPECGEKRVFEFQVMPQLVYFFEQESQKLHEASGSNGPRGFHDDFDFGTICVYTCGNNCGVEEYVEEFGYVQPPNA